MLRQLINGQTIKIDNHNCGKEVIWDRSIHFHKRMNSKKYRGAEVIIPIAEDGELEFRKIKGDEEAQRNIVNEISKAFGNETIRSNFVKSFYKSLDEILKSNKVDNPKEVIFQAADRLIKYFGVKPKFAKEFRASLGKYFITYSGEDGSDTVILSDPEDCSFIIGKDIDYVENFNIQEI